MSLLEKIREILSPIDEDEDAQYVSDQINLNRLDRIKASLARKEALEQLYWDSGDYVQAEKVRGEIEKCRETLWREESFYSGLGIDEEDGFE